ncbi:MAG TPA: tetratricopeptide repeat protein [Anaerolineae bacterium]|nr:tetratricopeptide repeat protein [Anaerolineae bacterium]
MSGRNLTILVLITLGLFACEASSAAPTPQPLTYYLHEASAGVEAGNYGEAVSLLEQASQVYPTSTLPLTQLGHVYLTRRQWKPAEDAFNRALARDLDNGLATAGLAEVYLNQGKPYEALKLWQRAAEAEPNLPGVFTGLGRTYLDRLDFEKARSAFLAQ